MDNLKQMLSQMADSVRSDTDWLVTNHIRQAREHDEVLAEAEQFTRHVLEVIVSQRQRLRGYFPTEEVPQKRPEQAELPGQRQRALEAMRQRAGNSGEQKAAAN